MLIAAASGIVASGVVGYLVGRHVERARNADALGAVLAPLADTSLGGRPIGYALRQLVAHFVRAQGRRVR